MIIIGKQDEDHECYTVVYTDLAGHDHELAEFVSIDQARRFYGRITRMRREELIANLKIIATVRGILYNG